MPEATDKSPARKRVPRGRRVLVVLVAAVLATPALLAIAYFAWRSTLPKEAPRIGVSMTTGAVRIVRQPAYEAALARAGGRLVALAPPSGPGVSEPAVKEVLDEIDALMLGGGADIDPALYGDPANGVAASDRKRDEFEIRLIHGALQRDMPILGICRGVQILNVAHGGTIRNLRADEALSAHHGITMDSFAAHDVSVVQGTHLAAAIGAGTRRVNSFHGQAVGRVGAGLRACATADDGVIEGIERPDRPFVIGIQWHPEIASLTDETALTLFRALVAQAGAYRTARGVDHNHQ